MTWLLATFFQMFWIFAFLVVCALAVEACKKLPDGWLRRLLLMKVD